ncbi:MAG TPA: hypothetical protein VHL31_11390, partial [Geminicoccus sp.]|uniref:hypothetical protein n=1 Tax=Geminicoccus sp. TaxID=2024832 RepID=UPI002E33EB77
MLKRFLVALTFALALQAGLSDMGQAATSPRCGRQYSPDDLYWRTYAPSVRHVLAQLPVEMRFASGNMMSLDYRVDDAGRPVYRAEFAKQWQHIFGTNTATGYGRLVRGSW